MFDLILDSVDDFHTVEERRLHRIFCGLDAALGCLVYTLLIIFLMPIVGIYFLCKPRKNEKIGGAVLLIVGLFLWAFIAFNS